MNRILKTALSHLFIGYMWVISFHLASNGVERGSISFILGGALVAFGASMLMPEPCTGQHKSPSDS